MKYRASTQLKFLLAALSIALGSAVPVAHACQRTGTILLDENFQKPDPGWWQPGSDEDRVAFGSSYLALSPPSHQPVAWLNPGYAASNIDLCVVGTFSENAASASQYIGAGVVFWATSDSDYYAAIVYSDGTAGVERFHSDEFSDVVRPTANSSIHNGRDAQNEIEIIIVGGTGQFWINDRKIADFRGEPPSSGSYIGVYGENSTDNAARVKFTKLQLYQSSTSCADETTDFNVPPQRTLREAGTIQANTPTSIPGGKVITTAKLKDALDRFLPFALIDVWNYPSAELLPTARMLDYAAHPGDFDDEYQQRLRHDLNAITQGQKDFAIAFYCMGVQCWESYNAALRAISLGYTNVYWYRGGYHAWHACVH